MITVIPTNDHTDLRVHSHSLQSSAEILGQLRFHQCDQIGSFLMFIVKYFLIKVTQIFGNFWGCFKKHLF